MGFVFNDENDLGWCLFHACILDVSLNARRRVMADHATSFSTVDASRVQPNQPGGRPGERNVTQSAHLQARDVLSSWHGDPFQPSDIRVIAPDGKLTL